MTQPPPNDGSFPARAPAAAPSGVPSVWFVTAAVVAGTVVLLQAAGRRWWCACGGLSPWAGDVWTPHCSQHLADAYTLSHFLHGLIFFAALRWARPGWSMAWRLCTAVAAAAFWEVLENSPLVIERYRASTMSLDYMGDSVINSLGDIAACALGFGVARRVGLWRSLAIFVAVELVLLVWIRDNLTLNVLMLIYPVPGIRAWQTAGHVGV